MVTAGIRKRPNLQCGLRKRGPHLFLKNFSKTLDKVNYGEYIVGSKQERSGFLMLRMLTAKLHSNQESQSYWNSSEQLSCADLALDRPDDDVV